MNVVFLGRPGTGTTHLANGISIRACRAGHLVQFATASPWVTRLAEAHHAGRLQDELVRLGRYPMNVVAEVGYIPFEPEAANLFLQPVFSRYERAGQRSALRVELVFLSMVAIERVSTGNAMPTADLRLISERPIDTNVKDYPDRDARTTASASEPGTTNPGPLR